MIELVAALQAESAATRWQALEKFNNSTRSKPADAGTLAALVKALADEHPFVRWQAGRALARQRAGGQKLLELLQGQAGHGEMSQTSAMRSAAIDALASNKSPELNAVLIEVLRSGDALVRQSAAEALARQGNLEAVAPLISALKDGDPWVRRAAAYALGHIGDPGAAGVLIDKLADEAVIVRRSAAYALGALRAGIAVPQLTISLTDHDPPVRRNAAWALGRIGRPEAVPALSQLLDDTALNGTIAITAQQAIKALSRPPWLQRLLGRRGRFH